MSNQPIRAREINQVCDNYFYAMDLVISTTGMYCRALLSDYSQGKLIFFVYTNKKPIFTVYVFTPVCIDIDIALWQLCSPFYQNIT